VKRQVPIALVIAPALLIVAAVGFFLLVKPKMDESSSLDDRIVEFQGKVDVALAAQRQATPGETIKVADLFRVTKAMPETTDMAGVILELNSVAERSGIDFLAITPGPPTAAPGGYQSVPIKLTFEGSYYDLTDFLFRLRNLVIVRDGELESDGRLFTLDALDLHEGTLGFPQVQAGLTVSAYMFAPGAVPAAGATGAPAATTPPPATTPEATTTAPTTTTPAPGQDPSTLGAG
jgi:Tfp pilus assembly protein PilO